MAQVWQIDFQSDPGGMYHSVAPVTCKHDLGDGGCWNPFQVAASRTVEHVHVDPVVGDLADSRGDATGVALAILGRVRAYNDPLVRVGGADSLNAALGDHITFGHHAASDALEFVFTHLPPGTYRLEVYANPTEHRPPRGFRVIVGARSADVAPTFAGAETMVLHDRGTRVATPEDACGALEGIAVDDTGTLRGRFEKIGGDPSIAAIRLSRR